MMTLLVHTFSIVFSRENGTNKNSVNNIKYEHSRTIPEKNEKE